MAADLSSRETRHDRRGSRGLDNSVASVFDPALDLTIRQLFEQQADIQAKLAALLPAKYVPNSHLERNMLRLKLMALEIYAQNQSQYIVNTAPQKRYSDNTKSVSPADTTSVQPKRLLNDSANPVRG